MNQGRFQVYKAADGVVTVYGLCRDGVIRYIGVASNQARRVARHCRDAKAGSQLPVHRWIAKHGKPDVVTLAVCASYPEAYEIERKLVSEYREASAVPMLNVSGGGMGGDGTKGRKLTEAHKAAISRANKGQNLGVPMPAATRAAISATTRGVKRGPMRKDLVQRMSEARKGIPLGPMSDETKSRLSESLKMAWARRRAEGRTSHSDNTREKIAAGVREARARK